jgi:glycosyltransferase involved in cell wall biosynthesis
VQYLIEALPTLDANVRLEIVGKGFLKDFLKKRAKELKVDNRVLFFQDLSRKELLQKYADADAFVLLSRHEAYSIAVAEALVAGTPCIVANASALTEWIDNESCFGVNFPINISELSNLINSVLEGKINIQAMKKWRKTKIMDWNDVATSLERIYE